jgi:hypothetical protein
MNAFVKILEVALQLFGVRTPRLAIDSRTGSALQSFEGAPQPLDRDVMQERGKLRFPVPCCRLTHASEPVGHTIG